MLTSRYININSIYYVFIAMLIRCIIGSSIYMKRVDFDAYGFNIMRQQYARRITPPKYCVNWISQKYVAEAYLRRIGIDRPGQIQMITTT